MQDEQVTAQTLMSDPRPIKYAGYLTRALAAGDLPEPVVCEVQGVIGSIVFSHRLNRDWSWRKAVGKP